MSSIRVYREPQSEFRDFFGGVVLGGGVQIENGKSFKTFNCQESTSKERSLIKKNQSADKMYINLLYDIIATNSLIYHFYYITVSPNHLAFVTVFCFNFFQTKVHLKKL